MPRKDRRNAHRYALARDMVRLGWWDGQQFRTLTARLRDLSLSGALVQLEEAAGGPAGGKVWICLADQSPTNWVQAETVELCQELPGTPRGLRLKFVDPFPYESFKSAVWNSATAGSKPDAPEGDRTPAPCNRNASVKPTNSVRLSERDSVCLLSKINPQTIASSGPRPEVAALPSPHPPTLLEAYRCQMVSSRKAGSVPWLVLLLLGLAVSILVGLLARAHMINLGKLGGVLGVAEFYQSGSN